MTKAAGYAFLVFCFALLLVAVLVVLWPDGAARVAFAGVALIGALCGGAYLAARQ